MIMKVKVKKLNENAVIPSYAKSGDAGLDLTSTSKFFDAYGNICYGCGLAYAIPPGYVGLALPRRSGSKKQLSLSKAGGVTDSGYRGEVVMKFKPSLALDSGQCVTEIHTYGNYNVGDRVAQMIIMPYPNIEFEESDELSETERNDGGYGSTGV